MSCLTVELDIVSISSLYLLQYRISFTETTAIFEYIKRILLYAYIMCMHACVRACYISL